MHTPSPPPALMSLRISTHLWLNDARVEELLALLRPHRTAISEVAFFTSFTHSVLPYATIASHAQRLRQLMPAFRALGLRAGINHLTTLGHLDENLTNSLSEPWQRITDLNGTVAQGSFCPLDPHFQAFTRDCYRALAGAQPDFIWIDDDVRLGHHPPAQFSCFCDLCLARFAAETGEPWTRARAAAEIHQEGAAATRAARTQWVAHNRRIIDELFALIRAAVDDVNPALILGYMPTNQQYEGNDYAGWGRTLAGPAGLPVKWRPGGGFYTDAQPLDLLRKVHLMGSTAAALPAAATDIQYEHENFPYQKLKKSETIFVAETAAALAAGCTGVALNVMGISPDPLDEYRPYFARLQAAQPLFERLVALAGRSPCAGLWPAMTPTAIWAARLGPGSADPLPCLTELAEIGLPPAYGRAGASVHLLAGDAVHSFTRTELEELLSQAVLLDGPALQHLQALGLAELAGFAVAGTRDRDTIERFTSDPLNGPHAGWWRDCRPSFWRTPAQILRPLSPQARPLAELIDFSGAVSGPVLGVFENALGGRIACAGYYPWTSLQNRSKSTQMKQLCRWLSRDRLPAYVGSFHKLALWCRRTATGELLLPLLNVAHDAAVDAHVQVQAAGPFHLLRQDGRTEPLTARADGGYTRVDLPTLAPWEMVLVISGTAN